MAYKAEEYLPNRFHAIKEFYDFNVANDPEFENAEEIITKNLNNRFPDTADLDGIKIWEKILNIIPEPEDSIEDRRFRITTVFQKRIPYTWSQLHKMMRSICGDEAFELKRTKPFVLEVNLTMDSASKLKSVIQMLEEVVPMHIQINVSCGYEALSQVKFAGAGMFTITIETPLNDQLETAMIYHGSPYIQTTSIETKLVEV